MKEKLSSRLSLEKVLTLNPGKKVSLKPFFVKGRMPCVRDENTST